MIETKEAPPAMAGPLLFSAVWKVSGRIDDQQILGIDLVTDPDENF